MTIRNGILSVEWRLAKPDTMSCKMSTESGLFQLQLVLYTFTI